MDSVMLRQAVFSILAGMLFGAGWWIFIDGYSSCPSDMDCGPTSGTVGYAWLPLAGATVSFLMINGMKWSELRDDDDQPRVAAMARIFLIFALLIGIVSFAGSAIIMSDKFLRADTGYKWAGISCLIGTLLVLGSGFGMRLGTLPPADA